MIDATEYGTDAVGMMMFLALALHLQLAHSLCIDRQTDRHNKNLEQHCSSTTLDKKNNVLRLLKPKTV